MDANQYITKEYAVRFGIHAVSSSLRKLMQQVKVNLFFTDHDSDVPLLDDHSTTTIRPTEGFILTTPKTDTQECIYSNITYSDGSLIKTEDPCKHCYCMKGDIVCAVPECGEPLEHEDCVAVPPKTGQCCPDTYICNGSETVTIPPESQLEEHQQHIVPQKTPVKGGSDTKRKGPVPEKPKDTKVDKSSEEDLEEEQFITTATSLTGTEPTISETEKTPLDQMPIENIPTTTVENSEENHTEGADEEKSTQKVHIGKPDNVDDRFSDDQTTFKTVTEHAEIDEPTTTFESEKPSDQDVSKPKTQTIETEEQTTDSLPITVKPSRPEDDEDESSGTDPTAPIQSEEDHTVKTEEPSETTTMTYSEEQGMSKGDGVSGSAESGESTEDKIPTTEGPSHEEKPTENTPSAPSTEYSVSDDETTPVIPFETDNEDMVAVSTTIAPAVGDEEKTVPPHVEIPAIKATNDFDETTVRSENRDGNAEPTTVEPHSDKDAADTTPEIPTRVADNGDDNLTSEEETTSKSSTPLPTDVTEVTTILVIDASDKKEPEEHTSATESEGSQEIETITTTKSIAKSPGEADSVEVTETIEDLNETTEKSSMKEISGVTQIPSEKTTIEETTEDEQATTQISPESSTKTPELDYAELPMKDIVTELPSHEEDVPEPVTLSQIPMESDSHVVDDTTVRQELEISTDSVIPSDESDEMNTVIPERTTNQPEKSHVPETTLQPEEKDHSDDHSSDLPSQVPGEGDCLFNGITYLNNAPIPTDEECLESCVCFNSIVRCKSTCDLESGTTESPTTDEEDTTAVVVEVTKPSVEFPAIVKEIYPTEAPILEDDNTEENEIGSSLETTSRPFVKAPLAPESNFADGDIQTTEQQRDENEFTTVPSIVNLTENVSEVESTEKMDDSVTVTEGKFENEPHGTDMPAESVNGTEKSVEHIAEKTEDDVTEKSEENITDNAEDHVTEISKESSTEGSDHKVHDVTKQSGSDEEHEIESTTTSLKELEETTINNLGEPDQTTEFTIESEIQATEKPAVLDGNKVNDIEETPMHQTTVPQEKIDIIDETSTEKPDSQVTESPGVEEISTVKQLDETSTYRIASKPIDDTLDTTEIDQTLATEASIALTPEESETTNTPRVEETTHRKPGTLDDRIGSEEDEQEVPETTTIKTFASTEDSVNQETIVPVLVKETTIKPLVDEPSMITEIDNDVTTTIPEKDIVLDQKIETVTSTIEKEIDTSTDSADTTTPESETTLSPTTLKDPVTIRTDLRPDTEETEVKPYSESSETVSNTTEKAEPITTEYNEQKTDISVHEETTAVTLTQESVEDLDNILVSTEKQDENLTEKSIVEEQKTEASSPDEKDTTSDHELTEEMSTEKMESEHFTTEHEEIITSSERDLSSEIDKDKKHLESPIDSEPEQEEKEESTTKADEITETTNAHSIEDYTTKKVEEVTNKGVDSSELEPFTQKDSMMPESTLEPETGIEIEKTTVSGHSSVPTEANEDMDEDRTLIPDAHFTERPEHNVEDGKDIQTDRPEDQTASPLDTSEDDKTEKQPETQTTVPVRSQFESSEDQDTTTESKIKDADVSEPQQTEKAVEDNGTKTEEETTTSRAEEPTTLPPIDETESVKVHPQNSVDEKVEKTETTVSPVHEEDTTPTATDATTNQVIEADVQATKKPTIDDIQKPIHHDNSIPEHPLEEPYTTNAPIKSPDSGLPQAGYPNYDEDYTEEDEDPTQFGPGTCRYGGKLYVSAQQIPRDDPCDFCFCFRSDIICLQQSCPPPIQNCHEEPISGFCCPRYECHVGMATVMNITTSTTTTTTTLPPHFVNSYKGAARKSGCLIQGKAYSAGEEVHDSSTPCMKCE